MKVLTKVKEKWKKEEERREIQKNNREGEQVEHNRKGKIKKGKKEPTSFVTIRVSDTAMVRV